MRLHTAGTAQGFRKPIIARVTTEPLPVGMRKDVALVLASLEGDPSSFRGYAAVIVKQKLDCNPISGPLIHTVREIDHLGSGHVVALEPLNGFIRTLYRPESPHNTLFATERCNSNCLMCSQPPIDKDDIPALTDRNLKLIDLMSPAPEYLCITGGEPTLLGELLLAILSKLRDAMPSTYVHMLTNGRRFAWAEFTSQFAAVRHPNLSLGIPLYSDDAALHDYIVQARDAFDQTVLGLHQLARHGVETEIRIVLHRISVPRLTHLAEYICRNLTFVDHVAFMGMEHIGYAPRNMEELWIDPMDYQNQLEESIAILARFGIDARIYNLQLCILRQSLWKYSKQAISDWKNSYSEPCNRCAVRERCGGFFQWATKLQSRGIHAIAERDHAFDTT
jgi:His-Xaa-Ser system radical SAM maturase HxsC